MLRKIVKVTLLSLVLTLLPSSFQLATSSEILWNPNVGNSLANTKPGLIPGAGIRGTNLLVYKENPDELIMRIIMNESFEDKPFSGKGRNMAMWIYWPTDYCWNENKPDCAGLLTVGIPNNPATYPNSKSSENITVMRHNKKSNIDRTETNCNAPWWIETTFKSRDTWSFAVSITCLGIPKEFGWYGYSSIDLGQKDVVTEFTQVQSTTYPFWDLAANAAAKNSQSGAGLPGINETSKQICAIATGVKGYADEQCNDSNNWVFKFCDVNPKADLQVLKNKKWVKLKAVSGVKNLEECPDDSEISGYYSYRFTSGQVSTYRIKNYGSKKYSIGYINLKIIRKDPI